MFQYFFNNIETYSIFWSFNIFDRFQYFSIFQYFMELLKLQCFNIIEKRLKLSIFSIFFKILKIIKTLIKDGNAWRGGGHFPLHPHPLAICD